MSKISKDARKELIDVLKKRYNESTKADKGIILAEFVLVSGYHRKHVIRLLSPTLKVNPELMIKSKRIYDEAVKGTLTILWEAADRICGKRLKALIPDLVDSMEKHGHLKLEDEIRKKVLKIGAATIDRLLTSVREGAGARRKRRQPKKVRKEIPIKTFADWKDTPPGFLEIDFVVHGGGSMAGEFLHSLVATDVCSGWVEAVALLAREQNLAIEGLKRIRQQLPVAMLGIDSDNDGAFINETLVTYCTQEKITFTRSRVHHKNDQSWIEQKNGAVIRKMVGHERFSGIVAGQALAQLLQIVRLYVNYFQPSFKLRERVRVGSKVKKLYYSPATPCDRLLAHDQVNEKVKDALRKQHAQLDPVELLHRIRQGQSALAALSSGETSAGPSRKSLDQFLAGLPELWRLGEARPTHRKEDPKAHNWRTREDPFKNVWTELLLWLQEEPDCIAKILLHRLNEKYPGQYADGLLRTLQRRISEWRQSMARKMVFGNVEEPGEVSAVSVAIPLIG
ncbi:MAG: integrase catalytic domain-containing protein [Armatimonadota bacterium]